MLPIPAQAKKFIITAFPASLIEVIVPGTEPACAGQTIQRGQPGIVARIADKPDRGEGWRLAMARYSTA
ncbi:MAG: hypothetical protein R3E03_05905 [Novosphingobium sp.]